MLKSALVPVNLGKFSC